MHEILPVHPVTGLTALAVIGGRPVWPVMGGDGTNDGDTNPPTEGNEPDEPGENQNNGEVDSSSDGDDGDENALGDAGKKALDATKAKWKSERDRRKELERQLAEATRPKGEGDEPTPDQIRADAEQAATAKANKRIIRAELKAAATGKLADPSDVNHFIDLDAFDVNDQGDVDPDDIAEAITDLLERKPHLAAGPKRRFQGSGDGGAGRTSKPKGLDDQIRDAEKAGNIGLSLRLKQQKLAQVRNK